MKRTREAFLRRLRRTRRHLTRKTPGSSQSTGGLGLAWLTTLALSLALVGAVTTTAANATTDADRYASPKGTGTACDKPHPCGIVTAINDASDNDTVVLGPGTCASISTTLADNGNDLTIEGAPHEAFPTIESSAATATYLSGHSTLEHLELDASGMVGVLGFTSTLSHVIVRDSGADADAVATHGTVIDSVVVASGVGSTALEVGIPANSVTASETATITSDTVDATGADGIGMFAIDNSMTPMTVNCTDIITKGTDDDIAASSDGFSQGDIDVDMSYSDYKVVSVLAGSGGGVEVHHDVSDTQELPEFVNAAAGNYREKPGSPTVDAGKVAGGPSSTDLAGYPRTLGHSTDIGAYELAPAMTLKDLKVGEVSKHEAHLTVKVTTEGFVAEVRAVAIHGSDRISSRQVTVDQVDGTHSVHLILRGLDKHTKYKVHAVATDAAGSATSPSK